MICNYQVGFQLTKEVKQTKSQGSKNLVVFRNPDIVINQIPKNIVPTGYKTDGNLRRKTN